MLKAFSETTKAIYQKHLQIENLSSQVLSLTKFSQLEDLDQQQRKSKSKKSKSTEDLFEQASLNIGKKRVDSIQISKKADSFG
jgi:hypothetical protein